MATPIPAAELARRIQQLIDDRQQHVDALAQIEETLASVGAALGGAVLNGRKAAATAAPMEAPAGPGKRRRRRGRFAVNAEDSILSVVKQRKNMTTQEVNAHFEDEGRNSTADNALSKLVREKKLKRTPLGKGIRGSSYSLA